MTAVINITRIKVMTIPFLASIKGYNKKSFKSDIVAGLIVTAIAVPEVMGIAALAGVPVQMGLYSILLAPVIFALFGASRRLIVGADSATAVMLAGGASMLATAGSDRYVDTILVLGLMSAVILAIITLFKLTFMADLISRPVMVGFLTGIGLQLMIGKLPEMIGVQLQGAPLAILSALPSTLLGSNGMAVTIATLVAGLIVIFRQSRIPGPLVGLLAAIVFALVFQVEGKGVAMVGALPHGLPGAALFSITLSDVAGLLPAALSIALVIVAQSSTVIRSIAEDHDERPDIKRDTMALSAAGVASAVTGGLAINGSPPRTFAADAAGMRTQVASIVMSLCVVVLLLFAGGTFAYVPVAALAAIVFMMGLHLIRFRELVYLARHHRIEFAIALSAVIGVLVLGVFNGIVIAVTVSLMERLRREYHPSDSVLLKDGNLSDWAKERVVGLKRIPNDMLVFGFDASLFFENVQYFGHRLRKVARSAKHPLRSVIIDTSAMDNIDYTAAEQLKQLYRHLSIDGIRLGFSHVSPNLMRQFENYGVIDLVGRYNTFTTLKAAIEYVPDVSLTVSERVAALKLPKEEYVVVGGAIMDVLNLRDSAIIDIVVSREVFASFADNPKWQQVQASSGKVVCVKDGIWIMRSWLGRPLGVIKRAGTFTKNGVLFMNLQQLILCKQRLARRKDQSDIALLKAQIARSRTAA